MSECATGQLLDGAGAKPSITLRTLCRALMYAQDCVGVFATVQRAVYEGLLVAYQSSLDAVSAVRLEALLKQHVKLQFRSSELKQQIAYSGAEAAAQWLCDSFWVAQGPMATHTQQHYIMTKTIVQRMHSLARLLKCPTLRLPVMIQGSTSSGKSSLVEYMARKLGHKCVRINNHEHTDLTEYLGQYVSDASGRLVYAPGLLVQAVTQGWWLVLDELNLAPSAVLESLNRLMDDHRELHLPETGQTLNPNSIFLFSVRSQSAI